MSNKAATAGIVCCVCNKSGSAHPNNLIQCNKCKLFVHKECYGIPSQYPTSEKWQCQRCSLGGGTQRCNLCPFSDGALKKTDNGGWAHILCAQYIPEVIFGNNYSMEPINLAEVPGPRFQQVCYICDEKGHDLAKRQGACMQCNVQNCINCFHVTCGQKAGLLVAEDCENRRIVDYYGFCSLHVKHNTKNTGKYGSSQEVMQGKYPDTGKCGSEISRLPKYSGATTKYQVTDTGHVPKQSEISTMKKQHSSMQYKAPKAEKLPPVETLSSRQLKEVTRVLPQISNTPMPFDTNHNSFKPMQPKVQAQPIPFQGVHKQDNIIEPVQPTTSTSSDVPMLYKKESAPTVSASTSSTTSANSTPTPLPQKRKRKSSSSTDTAESEDLGREVVFKTLQNINSTSREKSKLKITRQSAYEPESEGAEQYNDLMDLFNKTKKKKYKSPDSELSDYVPYNERKRNSLHKKGKRGRIKKSTDKDPGFKIRPIKPKIPKSPTPSKYSQNSYLYASPPKTPVKVEKSKLVNGAKGYSPTSIVSKMLEETKEIPEFKPCTSKPIISLESFFDRFKEMGMQYIMQQTKSEKSRDLLKELAELNQINSYLANRVKAKTAKLEELRCLKERLKVPLSHPMKALPEPAPISVATAKLLSTIHKPPVYRNDTILAETWQDAETVEKEKKESEKEKLPTKLPVPPSMTALVTKPPVAPTTAEKPPATNALPSSAGKQASLPTTDIPQIIIAGDPPMAYTYKDGTLVGYNPDQLQSSLHYNKVLEEHYTKVVEQQYKEKISAAYFEAQRRQYEGLLQHQMQSKMHTNEYLAQAYLSEPWAASYYYAQQQAGRQMPSLTAHFPGGSATTPPSASFSSIPGRTGQSSARQ